MHRDWLAAAAASGASPEAIVVAVVIATYGTDGVAGSAFPGLGTVATVLSVHRRSVERRVAELRSLGLLTAHGTGKRGTVGYSMSTPTPATAPGVETTRPPAQTPGVVDVGPPARMTRTPGAHDADPRRRRRTTSNDHDRPAAEQTAAAAGLEAGEAAATTTLRGWWGRDADRLLALPGAAPSRRPGIVGRAMREGRDPPAFARRIAENPDWRTEPAPTPVSTSIEAEKRTPGVDASDQLLDGAEAERARVAKVAAAEIAELGRYPDDAIEAAFRRACERCPMLLGAHPKKRLARPFVLAELRHANQMAEASA